jgi:hypothetical protein
MASSQQLADIHYKALSRFNKIQEALKDQRDQCVEDRRFYSLAGAQWEGSLEEQFENRARFEVNKIHLAVIRIINEYRANSIPISFIPKNGIDDDLSDKCADRYRSDEHDSVANEAYDNAFEEAVGGGIGAWRLKTVYEDEGDKDNDYQCIRIDPIFDADKSVYFDLESKRQDKSDAGYAYVISSMTRETYTETYDDDPASWPKDDEFLFFDWQQPDIVYIAEYYVIEEKSRKVAVFQHLDKSTERYFEDELKDDPWIEHVLTAVGAKQIDTKTIVEKKCHKYILSGGAILEDAGYIAGHNIPIVPVYGKRWFIGNIERCMGHVRLAKDAQRLNNMQLSRLAEISAYSPIEKPIFTDEQVAGHRDQWTNDNIMNYPYLTINPVDNGMGVKEPSGPVGYTKAPNIPPAMAALIGMTDADLKEILGNQQAGEQIQPNLSGIAVELIQNKLDMQSFIYISNMAKAIRRSAEIWLSMAREIYVENGRSLRLLNKQNKIDNIILMDPRESEKSGEIEYKNNFSKANFEVRVEVGPSTSSKRAATVRALSGMLQMTQDPETSTILTAMIMMNMEGEGLSDIRAFYRKKMISMGIVKPSEQEARELAMQQAQAGQAPPDASQQYLQAAAAESLAKAHKAQADTILTVAKSQETKAKTEKTLSQMDIDRQKQTLATIKKISHMTPADEMPDNASMPPEMEGIDQ